MKHLIFLFANYAFLFKSKKDETTIDATTFFERMQNITVESIIDAIIYFVLGLIIISIFYAIGRFFDKKVTKFLRTKTAAHNVLVASFFGGVVRSLFVLYGFFLALNLWGISGVGKWLLGAAGISTFIVGYALKDVFENFLAGLIIAFDPPFVLGSWVKVDDIEGTVSEMSLRQTILKTFDGEDVFIPNSKVLKNSLYNYTIDGFLRKQFKIGLKYGQDTDVGLKLIEETLAQLPDVLTSKGREPSASLSKFKSKAIEVECTFWINTIDNPSKSGGKILNEAMLKVLNRLEEAGRFHPLGKDKDDD